MSDATDRVAESIKAFRRAKRMSQDELAEAVGVHRQAVSNSERGVHAPTVRNLEDIARALGTTPKLLRSGFMPQNAAGTRGIMRATGQPRRRPLEPAPDDITRERGSSLVPPRAYELIYDYCTLMEAAGVPEAQVEEARRLMSGETFNTLRAHMLRDRDEEGWVKDVKAAWAFIKDQLISQGFDL